MMRWHHPLILARCFSLARYFLLAACLFFAGCKSDVAPEGLIEEDMYVDLLVEMQLVHSYNQFLHTGVSDSLMDRIWEEYDVTEEQFRKSHEWYQRQIGQQRERIDEAIERLRMDQVEEDPNAANKPDTP